MMYSMNQMIPSTQSARILLVTDRDTETVPSLKGIDGRAKVTRLTEETDLTSPEGFDCAIIALSGDGAHPASAISTIRKGLSPTCTVIAISSSSTTLTDVMDYKRAGADDVLADIITSDDLWLVIQRYIAQHHALVPVAPAPRKTGKVITITKSRGGIGATTVAVNLAHALVDTGKRGDAAPSVALVDLDLQFGAIASFYDQNASDTLFHLAMKGTMPDDRILEDWACEMSNGVTLFSAPEKMVPFEAMDRSQTERLIELLKARFDYVIIDLPHLLVDWISPLLAESDRLLLVTDTTVPSIRQARRLLDAYREDAMNLPVEIVVSQERKPFSLKRHHRAAARLLEMPLSHWLPPDSKAALEACDRGTSLLSCAPRSGLYKSICKIASSISSSLLAEHTAQTQSS